MTGLIINRYCGKVAEAVSKDKIRRVNLLEDYIDDLKRDIYRAEQQIKEDEERIEVLRDKILEILERGDVY